MRRMPRTLGVFHELHLSADFLWNQCDGPLGQCGDVLVRSGDRTADHALVINWPVPPGGSRRAGGWKRYLYKASHRSTTPLRIKSGYEWLGRSRQTTWALLYEPPPLISDCMMEEALKHCSRVYAPDPRATHPIALPSMWTFDDDLVALRSMPAPPKPVPLVAISSGKPSGKVLLPGHDARLSFFHGVKAAGLPLEVFGRGMPRSLNPGGSLASKASALRPARFALVIENYADGDQYVTEKLWDALMCWCLPVYFGSRAADAMIPPEAFLRLPDLGEAGLRMLREAVSSPDLYLKRLPAIAAARQRVMGELRMVEWIKRELGWA